MPDSSTYDVAVIGYGPTGVTAANLLGQMGLKVVVIERDADIYGRARAVSTDEEVMRIWQGIGLSDRISRDVLADRPLRFVDVQGNPFIDAQPPSKGFGHPPQQFIYQPALEKVLRDGVSRYRNVELMLQHECLRLEPDPGGVELMLADLVTDDAKRVRASYVIAADGGSSSTRAQLGIGYTGRTYAERWIVIDTKVLREWPGHDYLRFHCNPARPTVDCPTPLGHHRWEYPARAGEDENQLLHDAAIWKVLNSQGVTDSHVKILRAVIYSHHARVAQQWRVGRIFLAGDAAHAMPPWNGQGMSAGVRDVANLCWKLAAVIAADAPSSLLDSYQAERLPHVQETTKRAVMAGRIITERNPALVALRNRLMRHAMKLPGANQVLSKRLWTPQARYRSGFFAPGFTAAIGWQIPQPWVLDEHGRALRLDDVLDSRWTVLYTGARPKGTQAWAAIGVETVRLAGPGQVLSAEHLLDSGGTLAAWLARKKAVAVVVRPDGFIYTACAADQALPPPPAGISTRSRRAVTFASIAGELA